MNERRFNEKPGVVIIEGHVQGLSNTRSLGEAGVPVFVVDKNDCIAHYSKYCLRFFICPDFSSVKFVDFLIDLAKIEEIKGWVLIASNDHAIFTLSNHRNTLEKYYKIILPSIESIINIYDKAKLIKFAESKSIPVPNTYCLRSVLNNTKSVSFPVIIKGRFGLSFYKTVGKKVALAYTKTQLLNEINRIGSKIGIENIILQELIPSIGPNKVISFTAFCDNGRIKCYWMGEKLREHPLRFGTATFAKSVLIKECYDLSVPILEALNYTGVCEIEFLQDPRDMIFKLIEINPRTWLWVGLAKACGIDYAKIIYNYGNGLPYNYPENYNTEIKWRNTVTDFVYSSMALLKGDVSLKTILEQNKGPIVDAVSYPGDRKPFWAYLYLLVTFLFRR